MALEDFDLCFSFQHLILYLLGLLDDLPEVMMKLSARDLNCISVLKTIATIIHWNRGRIVGTK